MNRVAVARGFGGVLVVVGIVLFFGTIYFQLKRSTLRLELRDSSPLPPKLCRSLPSGVMGGYFSLQSTNNTLYVCFQQGWENGMIETRCVPMEECK